MVDVFIDSYASQPKVIILDCDDTNNNTYGQQQLCLFNNYYHDYCYMPLHIYEGLSGKLVTTILKPGRRNKQNNIASLLKKLVVRLRRQWPHTTIIVRGDSHFASKDFMEWCDQSEKVGQTGLTGNARLNATFKTLQNKIIKTAAWVKEMKTKIKIELPKFCPTKYIQTKSFEMLSVLVT